VGQVGDSPSGTATGQAARPHCTNGELTWIRASGLDSWLVTGPSAMTKVRPIRKLASRIMTGRLVALPPSTGGEADSPRLPSTWFVVGAPRSKCPKSAWDAACS
jgi:hypothetical protein